MGRLRKEADPATGVLEAVEDGQLSPDDLFDRICHEEHLKHCIRLVRTEVLESTFRAFQAYVMHEKPAAEVAESLGMSVNQVHAIKTRMTIMLRAKMRELLHDDE